VAEVSVAVLSISQEIARYDLLHFERESYTFTPSIDLLLFCANVSVLGVRYVADQSSSSYRRSVWALLVLVGVAVTINQIQDRVCYYFTHPVNVVIRDVHVSQLRFPTVTICSENIMSLSKMTSLGM